MVQRVYRQIKEVDREATVTIATSRMQVSSIHNQLGPDVGISVEPCRKDTFPAIALAAAYLRDEKGVRKKKRWLSVRLTLMWKTTIFLLWKNWLPLRRTAAPTCF